MQDTVKNKSNIKSIILSLLMLAVLVSTVFIGLNFWGQYRAEREYVNKQLAMLSQKQEEISDLEQKLDRAQKDMQIVLDKKPAETQAQGTDLNSIKDAYFLTRLAEDRLQYANDIQAAKQLLQLAQDNIAALNTPEIVKVKAILAADQEKLKILNYPDVQVTHEKLAILDTLINNMPLKPSTNSVQAKTNVKKTKENTQSMRFDKDWQRALNLMLEDLKDLVKIRKKTDSDLDLSYVNVEISKAQFKLLIEQIRWAIFYRDAVVYQRSVKSAQELLAQVFDANNENVMQFSKTLNELASVEIQPNIPSIKDAVDSLQALLVR
jgi:uncharacterized protein HemX